MKIFPLSEGTFTVDKTKHFVPFDKKNDKLHTRTQGSLLVEIQPFVVVTSKDILLLDTGLGFKGKNEDLQIHQNLKNAGIDANKVTKVLLTHLHKDHSGGISREIKNTGKRKLNFPQAKYYVQKKEMEFAFEKGFPSFITEELELLKDSPQVELLEHNKGTIENFIDYEVTNAHSPHHQVFWIRENDEIIFFGGDDAPQLQQMKHRFVAKYDHNGKKASQLRQQWWEQGKKEKWIFLFYHDVKNPVWKF
jgi:glyoxylase-like metal-dependent hydrolase (beta-lactamase superfamily II)